MQQRDSQAINAFQKQILSELGIVTWKLRGASDDAEKTESSSIANSEQSQAPAKPSNSGGLSGLDLIKQQMAKSSEAKNQQSKSVKPEPAVTVPVEPVPETTTAPEPPAKPVLVFKPEALIWQSSSLPVSDIKLSLEMLEVPYQLISDDSHATHRYPLLISAQPAQHLVADKSLVITSASSKKQLWQALSQYKQSLE